MTTRERILEAARALVETEGAAVAMEQIAERAGVSRRAVYDHFSSRTDLLVDLAAHVDETGELAKRARSVWDSKTGEEALEAFVSLNAAYNPEIDAIARAFERARDVDPAADAAWEDRMKGRRRVCHRLARWLEEDGSLAKGTSTRTASDLIWALTNIPLWRELTVDRGWSDIRYERYIGAILRRTLMTRPID